MFIYKILQNHPQGLMDILVFKTNLQFENDLEIIAMVLAEEPRIKHWNVDRDDIDNVLRIESRHLHPEAVIQLLNQAGYFCEELPD